MADNSIKILERASAVVMKAYISRSNLLLASTRLVGRSCRRLCGWNLEAFGASCRSAYADIRFRRSFRNKRMPHSAHIVWMGCPCSLWLRLMFSDFTSSKLCSRQYSKCTTVDEMDKHSAGQQHRQCGAPTVMFRSRSMTSKPRFSTARWESDSRANIITAS